MTIYYMTYFKNTAEEGANSKFIIRTSTDKVNWSGERELFSSYIGNRKDPGMIRLADNRLFAWFDDIDLGPPRVVKGINHAFSSDECETWTALAHLPFTVFTDGEAAGGKPIQLADGKILFPAWGWVNGSQNSGILRSLDNGATWQDETVATNGLADGHEYVEPALVELGDGTILMLCRSTSTGNIYYLTSADQGLTWSATAIAFAGKAAPRVTLLSNGKLVCVNRKAANPNQSYTILTTSSDGGVTWTVPVIVEDDFHTNDYADTIEVPGNYIGLAYGIGWSSTDVSIFYKLMAFADLP